MSAMKITIVFDNYPYNPSLETGFGFACIVDTHPLMIGSATDLVTGEHQVTLADFMKYEIVVLLLSFKDDVWKGSSGYT